MGLLAANPVEFLEKPSAARRDKIVTAEEYTLILKARGIS
jgi:hypothetical protein